MRTTSLSVLVNADKSTSFRILRTSFPLLAHLGSLPPPPSPPPSDCPGLDLVLDGHSMGLEAWPALTLASSFSPFLGWWLVFHFSFQQGGGDHCTSFSQLWWSEGQTVAGDLVLLSGRFLCTLTFLLHYASGSHLYFPR
jgi:hypothetical protein